ncbi:MAG: hypothetical protein V1495_03225 [Pseudomonadota bacterium]
MNFRSIAAVLLLGSVPALAQNSGATIHVREEPSQIVKYEKIAVLDLGPLHPSFEGKSVGLEFSPACRGERKASIVSGATSLGNVTYGDDFVDIDLFHASPSSRIDLDSHEFNRRNTTLVRDIQVKAESGRLRLHVTFWGRVLAYAQFTPAGEIKILHYDPKKPFPIVLLKNVELAGVTAAQTIGSMFSGIWQMITHAPELIGSAQGSLDRLSTVPSMEDDDSIPDWAAGIWKHYRSPDFFPKSLDRLNLATKRLAWLWVQGTDLMVCKPAGEIADHAGAAYGAFKNDRYNEVTTQVTQLTVKGALFAFAAKGGVSFVRGTAKELAEIGRVIRQAGELPPSGAVLVTTAGEQLPAGSLVGVAGAVAPKSGLASVSPVVTNLAMAKSPSKTVAETRKKKTSVTEEPSTWQGKIDRAHPDERISIGIEDPTSGSMNTYVGRRVKITQDEITLELETGGTRTFSKSAIKKAKIEWPGYLDDIGPRELLKIELKDGTTYSGHKLGIADRADVVEIRLQDGTFRQINRLEIKGVTKTQTLLFENLSDISMFKGYVTKTFAPKFYAAEREFLDLIEMILKKNHGGKLPNSFDGAAVAKLTIEKTDLAKLQKLTHEFKSLEIDRSSLLRRNDDFLRPRPANVPANLPDNMIIHPAPEPLSFGPAIDYYEIGDLILSKGTRTPAFAPPQRIARIFDDAIVGKTKYLRRQAKNARALDDYYATATTHQVWGKPRMNANFVEVPTQGNTLVELNILTPDNGIFLRNTPVHAGNRLSNFFNLPTNEIAFFGKGEKALKAFGGLRDELAGVTRYPRNGATDVVSVEMANGDALVFLTKNRGAVRVSIQESPKGPVSELGDLSKVGTREAPIANLDLNGNALGKIKSVQVEGKALDLVSDTFRPARFALTLEDGMKIYLDFDGFMQVSGYRF